ncbi:hypothetical protein FHS18_000144 [Paenibacillus phyllosphaerae]|uniref:Uncharacterized protein n=1 Tax=Paenibacillus phyllosphaerae TaxID=274593 RepID=A0A7W5FKG9_9BACL|nr:hypothetical protein [Paenibacillus phyllosphaerae]
MSASNDVDLVMFMGTSINLWQPNGAFLNDAIARFNAAKSWLTANG